VGQKCGGGGGGGGGGGMERRRISAYPREYLNVVLQHLVGVSIRSSYSSSTL